MSPRLDLDGSLEHLRLTRIAGHSNYLYTVPGPVALMVADNPAGRTFMNL